MSDSIPLSMLPFLSAAMAYTGRGGTGSCLQRSMALALDLRIAVITFGTLPAASAEEAAVIGVGASREPFIHCWCVVGNTVYAPTTVERTGGVLVAMRKAGYYAVNQVRDVRQVAPAAFARIERRYSLRAALKHESTRFGSSEVADALLEAAGVRYRLGENRALLPLGAPA